MWSPKEKKHLQGKTRSDIVPLGSITMQKWRKSAILNKGANKEIDNHLVMA